MKYITIKIILILTVLTSGGLNNFTMAQIGKMVIDLEHFDYNLDVRRFYSGALLIGTSRDNYYSFKDVSIPVEHPAEVLRSSSFMYQIDTLTSRRSDRGICHPDLLTYSLVMWTPGIPEARFGDYDFENVGMGTTLDHSLVLIKAETSTDEKRLSALKELLTSKYGNPVLEEFNPKNSLNEQCRWESHYDYIQLQITDHDDHLRVDIFRWQKKDRDLVATFRPYLFDVFFEQEEGKFYPI